MKKFTRTAAAIATAAVLTITGAAPCMSRTKMTANAVDTNNDDWLHAEGSRLYDMNGNEVWLTGANWFGLNCIEGAPHYLWSADCDDLLREVADRGINVIRFPISSELIVSWMNGEPPQLSGGGMQASYNPPVDQDDGNGGVIKAGTYGNINKDFVESDGKTLIDTERAFDIILAKCKKYGIKAFIDIHSPHTDNSGHNYNLWYGKAGITTDLWIKSLVWMADKYKNDDTLIAYDLKNEPHGKGPEGTAAAKWDGTTDENNWAYAATKCAEAILEVNPHALILVEGVEQSMSGAQAGDYWGMPDRKTDSPYIGAWWGGNFRGARDYPIKPKQGTSQIVYSPHDYGPSVYAQTWFEKDFTTQTLLDDYWYDTWAYINAENIAPELIGEWGGHMDGGKNQKWMELLRDYMTQEHTLEISNADILKQVEARTFKFGKARDNGTNDKLTNGVKLTDLGYDRSIALDSIEKAIGNIRSAFIKYAGAIATAGSGELKRTRIAFTLSSKWPSANGTGFDNDCKDYVANLVISDFLSLSLPQEADLYGQKAMQALKDAERKLYYKTA